MSWIPSAAGCAALLLCACAQTPGPGDVGAGTEDAGSSGGDALVQADVGLDAAPDAAPLDAGPPGDAAARDGMAPDAAPQDSSLPDVGIQDAGQPAVRLPAANSAFDYQLGGAYSPPTGVTMVVRDRTEGPAAGLYNICYINGFQIQPGEEGQWMAQHPELMLRDRRGDLVIDEDWGEILIDVSSPAKRSQVAQVVGGWIRGCKAAGYDAVEIDNLDSYLRAQGTLSEDDNVATMQLFVQAAHQEGLAIGQKNSAELVARRAELGTDFAIAEECNRYDECDVFTRAYGAQVFIIEYRQRDFDRGCRSYPQLSIVYRDLDLVPAGGSGYRYDGC